MLDIENMKNLLWSGNVHNRKFRQLARRIEDVL